MNCVSCDICVYHLLLVFFHEVFLSCRVTGAFAVTTGLIMRENNNDNSFCVFARSSH